MKRLLLTLAVAACVSGPIVASATEAAAQHRGDRYDRYDRYDRRDDRRADRRDRRAERREHRQERRWDRRRHNGYYYRNRWHYGAPPTSYYRDPYYRPGYTAWRRGAYLPRAYRSNSYRVYDYGRYRLRAPPRGYYWYRSGNDYLLAAIATGLIYEVIRH
jgi:Ni/Co efflux regulator RcnB